MYHVHLLPRPSYIPHGTAHEVYNLTATCAVSANFFDQGNVTSLIDHLAAKVSHLDAKLHAAVLEQRSGLSGNGSSLQEEDLPAPGPQEVQEPDAPLRQERVEVTLRRRVETLRRRVENLSTLHGAFSEIDWPLLEEDLEFGRTGGGFGGQPQLEEDSSEVFDCHRHFRENLVRSRIRLGC